MSNLIHFGREITGTRENSTRREWLVTNGIGGYAMGTVGLVRTRRYHGLLVSAVKPPAERVVILAGLDTWLSQDDISIPLITHEWHNTIFQPEGYPHIESFHLDGMMPVWTWAYGDIQLIQRIWMVYGKNMTFVTYTYSRGTQPLQLHLKPLIAYRDHHHVTAGSRAVHVKLLPPESGSGLEITPSQNLSRSPSGQIPCPKIKIYTDAQRVHPHGEWWWNFHLAVETYRGQDNTHEDLFQAGHIDHTLKPGDTFWLATTCMLEDRPPAWEDSLKSEKARQQKLHTSQELQTAPDWIQHLGLAADQFIVDRTIQDKPGKTILAGYPWFTDWGRDTMIAFTGLTLATRRYDAAASILRTFSHHVNQGMLPNRFPDRGGDIPEYNTVDATLWYFIAIYEYVQAKNDLELAAELFPVLKDIIEWHQKGTRFHIKVDSDDHLLNQGQEQVQLTWMDAKVGDTVITPRHGKAVEINALWYNALKIMAWLAQQLKKDSSGYEKEAQKVLHSFREKFWYEKGGYCYDVVDTPSGEHDIAIRPNQLFAVSLPFPLLEGEKAQKVVDICARHLLTSHGLRSLSPSDKNYVGIYGGEPKKRDASYHQGTTWGWLIGAFISAYYRVTGNAEEAFAYLAPLADHLHDGGLGTIAEIFDGNAPHTPRGCPAQAWSVAEVLRVYRQLEPHLKKPEKES